MDEIPDGSILLLSDSRGIFIPRDFALEIKRECVTGISEKNWRILEAGPDHEWYWEAWDEVCTRAKITDDKGVVYYICQDGDCWLVPVTAAVEEDEDAEAR